MSRQKPFNIQNLVLKYISDPTQNNRTAVVEAGIPYVRSVVRRVKVPLHPVICSSDLENEALFGLLKALDSYDTTRSTPFVSYAYSHVYGAVVDYLRVVDTLSRERRRRVGQAGTAAAKLSQALGRQPTDYEIADQLGISLEAYHNVALDANVRHATLLFDPSSKGSDRTALDLIPDSKGMEAFDEVDASSMRDHVSRLVCRLSERQRLVVTLYYDANLRLREIAQLMQVTEPRISQILGKAHRRLQELVEIDPLPPGQKPAQPTNGTFRKTKCSYGKLLKLVAIRLAEIKGIERAARDLRVSPSSVSHWRTLYHREGESAFDRPRKRRYFTKAFKLEALRLAEQYGPKKNRSRPEPKRQHVECMADSLPKTWGQSIQHSCTEVHR